ncbi:MAG: ferric iron uptake transcriptional regulator [Gammaproteobacteria bacterium]|nr:ferric iron uptake transcriptional regulator [Gammaproteobacteria bacterium]
MENSQLKKAGLKVTHPRVKILQILKNCDKRHMSAENVYKHLITSDEVIGLATVYRVLTQFEEAGIVSRHNFEGGHSVFELESGSHHDHLVCISCGKVVEFHDNVIEERQAKLAEDKGFELTDHSLNLYGKCTDCQ